RLIGDGCGGLVGDGHARRAEKRRVDDGWKRSALGRRENRDVESQFFSRAELQVDEPILYGPVEQGAGFDVLPGHIARRWRCMAEFVILEDLFHLLAPLTPLFDR